MDFPVLLCAPQVIACADCCGFSSMYETMMYLGSYNTSILKISSCLSFSSTKTTSLEDSLHFLQFHFSFIRSSTSYTFSPNVISLFLYFPLYISFIFSPFLYFFIYLFLIFPFSCFPFRFFSVIVYLFVKRTKFCSIRTSNLHPTLILTL